ncbi:hypothetical protein MKY92_02760 [Paenibacillus sp. FSL R5-0623]
MNFCHFTSLTNRRRTSYYLNLGMFGANIHEVTWINVAEIR